ncbi:pyridoxal phosphate-dependent aminotransferase [Clostridium botulinum]|uniref:pyridoxal phosphate-dependent aminotransferase n=1 Tax=Clostridium botulinum TaxID=1491 RepID=UPI00174EAF11|nr:pyridoxal phosphate-dependent aminotransferase [Clostridium botulinum]MBD5642622.1 pyridoxal phosphate-dependent aminotransferase [Clostridium botulinum]
MKNKFLAHKYKENENNLMSETANLKNKFEDIIDLSLGDPDIITDKSIIKTAFKDTKKGHTRYSDPTGDKELIEKIINFYKKDRNINFKENQIMAVVGACHGMYLALQSIINPGEEVIVHSPYFTPYKEQIEMVGGKFIEFETLEEDEFNINPKKLEKLINSKTKAIVLNSPNNPTGAFFPKELLKEIAKIAIENDLVIISDEVYDGFTYYEDFCSIAFLDGMKERTITLGSFSKDFCMTGWRIGYVAAPDYIINTMKNINEGICFSAPTISQRAAIYALKNRDNIVDKIKNEFRERMEYAYSRIESMPKLSAFKPKAGIYIFANIKETGKSSEEFCDALLNKAHIVAIPGKAFGKYGEGYIRIACTVGLEELEQAFDRIEKIL